MVALLLSNEVGLQNFTTQESFFIMHAIKGQLKHLYVIKVRFILDIYDCSLVWIIPLVVPSICKIKSYGKTADSILLLKGPYDVYLSDF